MRLTLVLLHQPDAIAFGIRDVREVADTFNAILRSRNRAAVGDDRADHGPEIVTVDRADESAIAGAAVLPLAQIAVEASGRRVDEVVVRRSPRPNLPAEDALVETTGAFHVVAFDFEVDNCVCHDPSPCLLNGLRDPVSPRSTSCLRCRET